MQIGDYALKLEEIKLKRDKIQLEREKLTNQLEKLELINKREEIKLQRDQIQLEKVKTQLEIEILKRKVVIEQDDNRDVQACAFGNFNNLWGIFLIIDNTTKYFMEARAGRVNIQQVDQANLSGKKILPMKEKLYAVVQKFSKIVSEKWKDLFDKSCSLVKEIKNVIQPALDVSNKIVSSPQFQLAAAGCAGFIVGYFFGATKNIIQRDSIPLISEEMSLMLEPFGINANLTQRLMSQMLNFALSLITVVISAAGGALLGYKIAGPTGALVGGAFGIVGYTVSQIMK